MIDENWWPEPLKYIQEESPLSNTHVVVAEISKPWGPNSYREINTALVPPHLLSKVLESSGNISHQVSTSSIPEISYNKDFNYNRWFFIWAKVENIDYGFEPLVVSWEYINHKIFLPDQGFLMKYRLVPRISEKENSIYWDDMDIPRYDIVKCNPATVVDSLYEFNEAKVLIDKEYLQDYATFRNLSIVQVYYASNEGNVSRDINKIMGNKVSIDIALKGRLINLRRSIRNNMKLNAQVWGARHLIDPNENSVLSDKSEYEPIKWPGIQKIVTKEYARRADLKYVYVSDSVLDKYEKQPKLYDIDPESGSVCYKGIWCVSRCTRIGRNIIQIELKTLYEGVPAYEVKHFHEFAVEPPGELLKNRCEEQNVGTRSKRIIYNLVELGEILADISKNIMNASYKSEDFVKLNRSVLDYKGWWTDPSVFPITKYIPVEMDVSVFLERCISLNVLIIESLNEKNLREVLLRLNHTPEKIKKFKGLKLLEVLMHYGIIVKNTGLSLISDLEEIESRIYEKLSLEKKGHIETPLELLFALNNIRNATVHGKRQFDDLLEKLNINIASLNSGYGYALDGLYDGLGDCLEDAANLLSELKHIATKAAQKK